MLKPGYFEGAEDFRVEGTGAVWKAPEMAVDSWMSISLSPTRDTRIRHPAFSSYNDYKSAAYGRKLAYVYGRDRTLEADRYGEEAVAGSYGRSSRDRE